VVFSWDNAGLSLSVFCAVTSVGVFLIPCVGQRQAPRKQHTGWDFRLSLRCWWRLPYFRGLVYRYQRFGETSCLHLQKCAKKGTLLFDYPQDGVEKLLQNFVTCRLHSLKLNPRIAALLYSERRRPLCSTQCIQIYTASHNSFQIERHVKWIPFGKSWVSVKIGCTEILRGCTQSVQVLFQIRPQLLPYAAFPIS
jgi:hypothetical protein